MADWELVDRDPFTGVRKYLAAGDDPDSVLAKYEYDNVPILDANKAEQNEDFDRRGDMWHAARIPIGVMFEWYTKHGVSAWNPAHMDAVKRLLNSNEYRHLRVRNFIL